MNETIAWDQPQVEGGPTPRNGHSLSAMPNGVVLFGGIVRDTGSKNDLYFLETSSNPWRWVKPTSSGVAPSERSNHSATALNDSEILFFGGQVCKTTLVLYNDLHVLNTATWQWTQPTVSGTAPTPRGRHSAVLYNRKLYVFGGYGAANSVYGDLHCLDIETWTWSKPKTKGNAPKARFAHAASLTGNRMFVLAGTGEHNSPLGDCAVLNLDTMEWADTEAENLSSPQTLCKHASVGVRSAQSHKLFVFGGQVRPMYYSNVVDYYDTETSKWGRIEAKGKPISARCDCPAVYDVKSAKLVMFGGWANEFLGDLHTLDVAPIVGPPYELVKVEPEGGPVITPTQISIFGVDFIESTQVKVMFTDGANKHVVAPGKYISSTEIQCTTPSFESFGPSDIYVRVCLSGEQFTVPYHRVQYKLYLDTKAQNCFAYGPGILPTGASAMPTSFVVWARDRNAKQRKTGGDKFTVSVVLQPPADNKEAEPVAVASEIEDMNDGTYFVSFNPQEQGIYQISVMQDGAHIRGSPFTSEFRESLQKSQPAAGTHKYNFFPVMKARVPKDLTELEASITNLNKLVAMEIKTGDLETLIKVMGGIDEVKRMRDEFDLRIAVLSETAVWLKNNGDQLASRYDKRIQDALKIWTDVKRDVPVVDKNLKPHKERSRQTVQKDIEQFVERVKSFRKGFNDRPFNTYSTGITESYTAINQCNVDLSAVQKESLRLKQLAELFDFTDLMTETLEILKELRETLVVTKQMWDIAMYYERQAAFWRRTLWDVIDTNAMEEEVKKLPKEIRGLHKNVRATNTFTELSQAVRTFQNSLPLIANLHHPSMRDRHWKMLMKSTGREFIMDDNFSLQHLIDLNLPQFQNDVEEIVDRAQKEEKMELTLNKIDETWKSVDFVFIQHKQTDLNLVNLNESDFETLEDQQVMVQNMIASKYLSTYEELVMGWRKSLANVADVMQLFQEIQRTWAYLEVLFIGSEEVQRELPDDVERFKGIDKIVRDVLRQASSIKNVVKLCNQEGLLKKLQALQSDLNICEKALADYLESKRAAFPRFYFVSTADLLDILSNGNNPRKIMKHTPKIFQAIKVFNLQEKDVDGRPVASGIESCVGIEQINLNKPLPLLGRVEEYLEQAIKAMQLSVKMLLKESIRTYEVSKPRHEWLKDHPSQCMLLATQVHFTTQVEECFLALQKGQKDAMKVMHKKQIDQLTNLIKMVQGDLEKSARQKVMILITIDTHARDVVGSLAAEGIDSKKSFAWQSQLKQYWEEDRQSCFVRIADAEFEYGYEYLGNGPRLVITPLTDRIYITASQSLHLKLGCAPAGPAGTGKTETTKDLASQCGKAVYVFNCSDQMDYQSMGNIYKGLAASGSWGCFDEFNRLVPEVLSVCSVQFKTVIDAIRGKKTKFTLLGSTLNMDPTCGVFITMNPGYLGRSELPESLKALFRPITVVVPDLELICENMLMAEGFIEAKILARKFVTLYALCRDLLSKQDHYDWGLRAIKTVLVVAGTFKRADPEIPESFVLMRALRDSNLAKIPAADVPVFMGLISDLFPGIELPRKVDPKLETTIRGVCTENNLYPDELFLLKIQQLDELLVIRHCIFVIGTSGNGKSAVWSTLAKTWTKMGRPTTVRDIDPKAISANELYGYIQLSTREWKDGLLSNQMRELSQIEDTNPKWIILDGDLDTNWIESMNSVMDDNKILTLASNERISLLPHMRLIFEIRDLRYATPATVSRAGIIYVSDATQWRSYAISWINTMTHLKEESRAILLKLFDAYVPVILDYMMKTMKTIIAIVPFNQVQMLCNILTGLLTTKAVPDEKASDEFLFETFFVWSAVWSFGSALAEKDGVDYRKLFSEWWKEQFKAVKFPARGSVFDVWLDPDNRQFVPWREKVAKFEYTGDVPMSQCTVPTPETTSVTYFLDLLTNLAKPVMLVGNAGCGKTALMNGKLRALPESLISTTVNLNYYTTSADLQRALEGPLEKKAGRNYGPPGAKKLIYFIDDLNMPMLDPYNTQTPIALMRQHVDYGHWYDRTKLSFQNIRVIQNTQYVAAMNPTAGSFNINPRLQRHFAVFAVDFPSQVSLMDIYRAFLTGHLTPFTGAVQDLKTKLIEATLMLHSKVVESFRKTAVNFHYEFNIRHLANVFQGLLMSTAAQFKDDDGPCKFVELWLHECERVYCDRLVNAADISSYKKLAKGVNAKYFSQYNLDGYFREKDPPLLVFCHFANGAGDKVYNKAQSLDRLRQILEDSLNEYNEENAQMNLLLFEDAMRHVCRISRIIENPSGHALLVGVGGSGKQSLSRLAAYVSGYAVVQITISSTYGVADLKEDLKNMYMKSGVKDEGLVFLFTDSQITDERFLVMINDLLASGDIPDLFATEDKDNIINTIRMEVKAANIPDTRENCWEFFLNKVRRNLHVVLCFSPVGEAFAVRPRRFPALVNCTVIDWFHPWPEDALLSVARRFLSDVDLGSDQTRDGIVRFMPFAFKVVNEVSARYLEIERRYNYTTPKSFLGVIDLYKSMLNRRRSELTKAIERLQSGLEKLVKTSKDVSILEEELKIKSVEVEEKKESADAFAETVGQEKSKVEAESQRAAIEQEKCERIATDVGQQQRECAKQLAEAEPAVKRAEAALDTVTKKDLGETKSLKTPPPGIEDVTAAVMVLLSDKKGVVKDRSWKAAVNMMGAVDKFLTILRTFKNEIDSGNVPAANFVAVRPYIALPHFTRDKIVGKSKACAGLCDWVLNIVEYYDIVAKVEPLRMALKKAEDELAAAESQLNEVRAKVAELMEQLRVLVEKFDAAVAEKEAAIAEANRCKAKLDLAQRLIRAVGSEQERWGHGVEDLNKDLEVVSGDVLLAAVFVSYIGGFSKVFRLELIEKHWIPFLRTNKVPLSASTDILKILTDDAEMAGWQSEALPSDRQSMENGVIVTNCERWPLIVDPQLQGIRWIKEKEAKHNLLVLRLGQNRMLNKLEHAIEAGHSVLIENLGEKIDAVLSPVIARQTIKKLGILYVRLGDHEVEYNKNFKLFLHTKLSNPHYPPEVQAETTLINFTVTEEGLEDQLLAVVVQKERPDLEEMKASLIAEQNDCKIQLKDLEDGLLRKLAGAQGDLTEDVQLIENLEDMKRISDEIKIKMKVATVTETKINKTREIYRPVATRGSLLFFLLMNLRKINTFYQYSLAAFKVVFLRGIDRLPKIEEEVPVPEDGAPVPNPAETPAPAKEEDENLPVDQSLLDRIGGLIECITYAVFQYVRRGLFEKHKLIFATQLTFKILYKSGQLDEREFEFILQNKKAINPPPMGDRLAQFLTEAMWASVQGLIEIPAFAQLADDMQKFAPSWEKWCNEEKPEIVELPFQGHGQYKWNTLSKFQKLLIIRALRPDRITSALVDFVEASLGKPYVDQEPFDILEIFKETGPATPLFFVLFPGAAPFKDIEVLAGKHAHSIEEGNLVNMSMGQGQEKIAEGVLDNFTKDGGWVFLDNVHLMQRWLSTFELKMEQSWDNGHQEFRCFFSAEYNPDPEAVTVPESVIQTSVKVINEPLQSLKANLKRALQNFDDEYMNRSTKPREFKALLFGLCFFHALVLGRRKFGCQGWSRFYSFNNGDLTISADVLGNYLDKNPTIPWEDLRYMFGEIMYGGHITDKWDRRTCNTYLKVLLTDKLLDGKEIAPGFPAPPEGPGLDHYIRIVDEKLPREGPVLFGLHPNAEIGFLTAEGDTLFQTIQELEGAGGGKRGGSKRDQVVMDVINNVLEKLPAQFDMLTINSRIPDKTPYLVVMLQECERMNGLLFEIQRSLSELKLGLQGALNISEAMEALTNALFVDRVPGTWTSLAYPSLKGLGLWFSNLLQRVDQLSKWSTSLQTPVVVWISGMFNPMAFLTAVMQVTARQFGFPLDNMTLQTDVIRIPLSEITAMPEQGAYVHGMFLEGARWDEEEGCLADQALKQLHPSLPIMHVTALAIEEKVTAGTYECPVYITTQRGPTFVFAANLKTKDDSNKWILRGCALLMNDD